MLPIRNLTHQPPTKRVRSLRETGSHASAYTPIHKANDLRLSGSILMLNSAIRYELLEELARLALQCRNMITGASPEGAHFQEVVDRLSVRPGVEPDDEVVGLLNAIGRGPDRDKQSLYWQAAALIPV